MCLAAGVECISNLLTEEMKSWARSSCLPMCTETYATLSEQTDREGVPFPAPGGYWEGDSANVIEDVKFLENITRNPRYIFQSWHQHVPVTIYFEEPTFYQVKRDAKTNLVTKISAFGGTLGLFTGFSLLRAVEIVYWILKTFRNIVGQ